MFEAYLGNLYRPSHLPNKTPNISFTKTGCEYKTICQFKLSSTSVIREIGATTIILDTI
jgi:hypothetical protein